MNVKLSNKAYDVAKYVAQIALPAIATFLLAVLPMWDVSEDMTNKVVTTVVAANALLGSLLLVSNVQWKKEHLEE